MKLAPFELERYFAKHEFSTRYLLSSSDCDGLALAEVLSLADGEARGLWDKLTLGYCESQGLPLLRREIAALHDGLDADEILVAAPQELVLIAMSCLLDKGDHVVCTFPGYQSLYQIPESIGCRVDRWEPVEEEGWRFRIDDLLAKLRPETKLLIINFPHNPTGSLPSAGDFRRIMEIARERVLYVFSDEMYRYLELDPKDRLPAACELYEKAVSLSGMSKSFGLAGLRVGWLATKDAGLRARFLEYKDYTTICAAGPSEILALIGLRARDAIIARHRARIQRNLLLLDAFFAKHSADFSWIRPKAGTIGFPGLIHEKDPEAFCARAREAEVLLMPSTVYGYPRPHFRIGFGRENMPEALVRLAAALRGA
ncbi:MAG: aspartate aminotransferase [Elusimicrobia bacterium CG11_big_fil_rev_8_21_14_0_20_64_6]|nr:MAG: aspartate aminotransferase [Elusimicrobia bacterium CG11_big_fil_rev_8_21_14_0_20_64_6]